MKPSHRWILGLSIASLAVAGYRGMQAFSAHTLRPAPDFTLPVYTGGRSVRLSALKGKVVLVNFYETSCPHCQHEMGDFDRVYRELNGKGFEIVGISLDQDGLLDGARQVSEVARRYRISYPLVIGNDEVGDRYGGIDSVPMSFLVDRQGRLARTFPGAVDARALEQAVAPLL